MEAARAGEQGRGFAVVASEVRNLAQRSAAAAKEIKRLIDDSVSKVEAGSQQVAEAGKTMEEIVASVRRVTDIMGEIASASQEQTQGIEQINQAITNMDQVTQQNAALVEQAAAWSAPSASSTLATEWHHCSSRRPRHALLTQALRREPHGILTVSPRTAETLTVHPTLVQHALPACGCDLQWMAARGATSQSRAAVAS